MAQYCYLFVILIGVAGIFIPYWQPYSGATLLEAYQLCDLDSNHTFDRLNLDQTCQGVSHPHMKVSYQVMGSLTECLINQFPSETDLVGHKISDRLVYNMYKLTLCSIFSPDRSSNIYYRRPNGKDRSFSTYLGGGVEFAFILGRYIIFPICWLVIFIILMVKICKWCKRPHSREPTL